MATDDTAGGGAGDRAAPAHQGFKAEIRKVLDLVIGSLYTHREIFLRELISNASDALERLRFEAVQDESLYEDDGKLQIRIEHDAGKRTLSVIDNGIGMGRDEIAAHLGTIAGSGTRRLLESLEQGARAPELIGQFGVGFYAAFMVAGKVVVESRRAGAPRGAGVRWSSTGAEGYTIEELDRPKRGTRVTLELKEDAGEYLDGVRLRDVVHRYSDHIGFPIFMPAADGGREQQVNRAAALWTLPRKDINEREYHEFYRHLSHELGEPLCYTHSRVEGKVEYTCLLYVPAEPPLLPYEQLQYRSVRLYIRRVFIMDRAEEFLPPWLRFVRGVVDAEDLPLNVSRETLQANREVEAIRRGCARKVLDMLRRLADDDVDRYARFWRAFGAVLKEGALEDSPLRDDVIGLLRFYSTCDEDAAAPSVSLADYAGRMPADQREIYCLTADSLQTARRSPHLEALAGQGREVLLMTDPIDEWLVLRMPAYREHPLRLISHGELELPEGEGARSAAGAAQDAELAERVAEALGERVCAVRISTRLRTSAACLVYGERDPSSRMRRMLEAGGRVLPPAAPTLELNPDHALVRAAREQTDAGRFADVARLLLDQAHLNEGALPSDPAGFVQAMNRLLTGADSAASEGEGNGADAAAPGADGDAGRGDGARRRGRSAG